MNTEIVKRLINSFRMTDQPQLIADALVNGLDDEVLNELVDKVLRDHMTDEEAYRAMEEEQERIAKAGDYAQAINEMQVREGDQEDSK